MFGDSPEKLLEDIKVYKTQEAAWRKDNSTNVAKRGRSNYLVMRARALMEEGDLANSDRLLREAEKIDILRAQSDLKPEQLRQQLARKIDASPRPAGPAQPDGALLADAKRSGQRRPGSDTAAVSTPSGKVPAVKLQAGTVSAAKGPAAQVPVGNDPVDDESDSEESMAQLDSEARVDSNEGVNSDEGLEEQPEPVLTADARRGSERRAKAEPSDDEEKPDVSTAAATKRSPAPGAKAQAESLELPADDEPQSSLLPAGKTLAKSQSKFPPENRSGSAADRAKAQEFLNQAQLLLHEGRTDEARAKVQQAEKLDVAYDVLGMTPEYLLAMIERAESDTLLAQAAPASTTKSTAAKTAMRPEECKTTTSITPLQVAAAEQDDDFRLDAKPNDAKARWQKAMRRNRQRPEIGRETGRRGGEETGTEKERGLGPSARGPSRSRCRTHRPGQSQGDPRQRDGRGLGPARNDSRQFARRGQSR